MYNSSKPWGKLGEMHYQHHIVNWRELLVWIHENRIDIDYKYRFLDRWVDMTYQIQWAQLQMKKSSGNYFYIIGYDDEQLAFSLRLELEVMF